MPGGGCAGEAAVAARRRARVVLQKVAERRVAVVGEVRVLARGAPPDSATSCAADASLSAGATLRRSIILPGLATYLIVPTLVEVAQVRSAPCRNWPKLGPIWWKLGQLRATIGEASTIIGQFWHGLGHIPPDIDRSWPELGQTRASCDRSRPNVARLRPHPARIRPTANKVGPSDQTWADFDRVRSDLGQSRPNLAWNQPNLE